jgi:hypothetical protein
VPPGAVSAYAPASVRHGVVGELQLLLSLPFKPNHVFAVVVACADGIKIATTKSKASTADAKGFMTEDPLDDLAPHHFRNMSTGEGTSDGGVRAPCAAGSSRHRTWPVQNSIPVRFRTVLL